MGLDRCPSLEKERLMRLPSCMIMLLLPYFLSVGEKAGKSGSKMVQLDKLKLTRLTHL